MTENCSNVQGKIVNVCCKVTGEKLNDLFYLHKSQSHTESSGHHTGLLQMGDKLKEKPE